MGAAVKPLCDQKNGAPGGIRTHDPQIRNLVLYPAELRALGWSLRSLGMRSARGRLTSV